MRRKHLNDLAFVSRFLLLQLVFLLPISLSAQIEETGSLRQFLMGNEPNCAYDNWISHTVEATAEPGGHNDFMPVELDRQLNGFGNFQYIADEDAAQYEATWKQIFRAFWLDDADEVEALIDEAGYSYELVYFTDTDYNRHYRILREVLNETFVDSGYYAGPEDDVIGSFDHGWGIFILNEDAEVPWICSQVCHINDDFVAPPFAMEFFLQANLGTLAFHATSREALWNGGEFYNARSISDPSRNGNMPFQWFTEFFVDTVRAQGMMPQIYQVHSYDSDIHDYEHPVQISPGQLDDYANRPVRDLSSAHLDWVNFTPEIILPANTIAEGQDEVTVGEYYAAYHAGGLEHVASGTEISNDVSLPGYSNNQQMFAVDEGRNPYESLDGFVHFEFDELPDELQDLGWTYLDFYDGPIPPTIDNFGLFFTYYGPALDALVAYVDNFVNVPDTTAPVGPDQAAIEYASDYFVGIEWSPTADDPNFAAYEVYYDTTETIDTTSNLWSYEQDADLRGLNARSTLITDLIPLKTYGFRVRAIDFAGNSTELTPTLFVETRDTTLPEIDPHPPITSYPTGAWAPWVECRIKTIESLDEAIIESWYDGVSQPSVPLLPQQEWVPETWIRFSAYMYDSGSPPAPGTTIRYRIKLTENSYVPHIVYEPELGFHEFTVTVGEHKFEADFQFDDGGMIPSGAEDTWVWGEIETGPGQSYDGTHAWHATPQEPGSESCLELPQPLSSVGMPHAYLVFEQWYNTALNPNYAYQCYDGGIVQVSTNNGYTWQAVTPAYGYPKGFASPPYNDVGAFGGDSEGWITSVFKLNYTNDEQYLRIRFLYKTDTPIYPSEGWIIDNVRLTSHPPPPREVRSLRVSFLTGNHVRLMWSPDQADYYRIYRGTDPFQPMELLDVVSSPWYTDNLAMELPYPLVSYRVVAIFAQ